MFDELTFFRPVDGLYMVDPLSQMGIHCRFGMKGVIAGSVTCVFIFNLARSNLSAIFM